MNRDDLPARAPKRPQPDTRHVDLDVPGELEYWLKFFDTSKDELVAAIAEVGPYAGAVAIRLKSIGATEDGKVT